MSIGRGFNTVDSIRKDMQTESAVLVSEKDDWRELFDFQKSYRSERRIGACRFLRMLDMPPYSARYLNSSLHTPSKKDGSIGQDLRQKLLHFTTHVSEYKLRMRDEHARSCDDPLLADELIDFVEMNKSKLLEYGIEDVYLGSDMNEVKRIYVVAKNSLRTELEDLKMYLSSLDAYLFDDSVVIQITRLEYADMIL